MKIQDYNPFISIRELFGILLPGTIVCIGLLYGLDDSIETKLMDSITINSQINTFLFGLIFLLISYFFGHIIFQLGSYVDDWIYDPMKDVIYDQIRLQYVREDIRTKVYSEEGTKHLSTFDWSLNRLRQLEAKSFYSEVEAIIADAKFFRSFLIIGALCQIVFECSRLRQYSNLMFLLFVLIVISYLFNLIQLHRDKDLGDDEKKKKKKKIWSRGKWVLGIVYLSYLVILLLPVVPNSAAWDLTAKQVFGMSLTLSLITFISTLLYFRLRQKSCRKLYTHIIYLDRSLLAK